MFYDTKVVYCNNVIEVYQYKTGIASGYKNKVEKTVREQTDDVKKENFRRSLKRTKTRIRQLINTNYVEGRSSFLTLTFKDNMRDYDVAFKYWDLFKKKVEYRFKKKLEYVGVVEFQNKNHEITGRNAIHFHIALFDVDFMEHKILYELWQKTVPGGVHIESVGESDNVGAYLTKYMGKEFDDFFDNEYKGKKRYFMSRGLKEPEVIYYNKQHHPSDKEQFETIDNALQDYVVYEYVSEEYEIKKKDSVSVMEEVEMVQQSLEGTNVRNITIGYEEVEKRKELSENVVGVQQLHYKQIVLKQNKTFRNEKCSIKLK